LASRKRNTSNCAGWWNRSKAEAKVKVEVKAETA
jgi:hypothetical protein